MKTIARRILWALFFAVALTACGGGGGGGGVGGGGNEGITYAGVTTQTHLSAASANAFFSLMWEGESSLGEISSSTRTAKSVPADRTKIRGVVVIAKFLRLRLSGSAMTHPRLAKTVSNLVSVNETIPGAVSGTMAMTGNINDTTGTGIITVTCTNFNDGDGYIHDGLATLKIDAFDTISGIPTNMTMSFSQWFVKSATSDASFNGSIIVQASTIQSLTINLDGRDNISKETFRFKNFVVNSAYNDLSPPLPIETYSGRVFIEKLGYVEISTVSPCIYSPSELNPTGGGPIIFSGAGNSKAVIAPVSYGVRIEVDENGDTVTDKTNRYFWDNLTGPSFISLAVVPTSASVPAGLTQHFMATGTFSDNSTKDLTSMVTWTSSDTAIAQISSKDGTYSMCWDLGCAYAGYLGSSTITAALGDVSGTAMMEVSPAVLVSLDVHPLNSTESSSMAIGMTRQYEALGTFSNNYRGDVTSSVTWSTSDSAIATISNATGSNGKASSLSTGTTTITATSKGLSGATTLSVSAWSLQNSGTLSDLYRVVWGGSRLVTTGADGIILTSSNGKTFQQRTSSTSATLYDIAWSGNTFVAVGASGTILTSTDGTAWTQQASGIYNNLYGVAWSGSKFVAVGAFGTVLTSPNGIVWTAQVPGNTNSLHSVAWSGSKFVAVGAYGTVLTSTDGSVWTEQISGTPNHLGRVVSSGSQFLAVSGAPNDYGSYEYPIHASPDGVTWTNRTVAPYFIWQSSDVAWCGTQFVVAGAEGNLFTSGDGINWAPWIVGTNNLLRAVSCSGAQYTVTGRGGMILSFP